MSELDPVIVRQFGWLGDTPLAQVLGDLDLAARMAASYRDDAAYSGPQVPSVDVMIDGPLGPASLRVRVYTPEGEALSGAGLVWSHGGGWVGGQLDDIEADAVSREVATRTNGVVVSVDYHVADGSTSYPNLHREVMAAFGWTVAHADELGIEVSRVVLGGASAGANLSIGAALELRDRGEQLPAALALIYPALYRDAPPTSDSHAAALDTVPPALRLPPEMVAYLFAAYLGSSTSAPYASVDDQKLDGLPPCLVVVNEFDDLRSSGEFFIEAARAAAVDVTSYLAAGAIHGHLAMTPHMSETNRTLDVISRFVAGSGPGAVQG